MYARNEVVLLLLRMFRTLISDRVEGSLYMSDRRVVPVNSRLPYGTGMVLILAAGLQRRECLGSAQRLCELICHRH